MGIFHAYDIRGIYETEVTIKTAVQLAYAYTKVFKPELMLIGHDPRLGSEKLANALADAFRDAGVSVIFSGLITTPMLYFGINEYNCSGGIMVTASHNPKEYAGFKICRENAIPVGMGSGLERIQEAFTDFEPTEIKAAEVTTKLIHDDYLDFILPFFPTTVNANFVIDCSNGSAGPIVKDVLINLDAQMTILNEQPDGNFPNHEPNPMLETARAQLVEAVKAQKADFGVIFDGDADRLLVIDENGEVIRPDILFLIIAKYLLEENPKTKLVYDLRSTKAIAEIAHQYRTSAYKTSVGHTNIKKEMRNNDADFGGELSGHYYYKDFYYCDNAILTLAYILHITTDSGIPISELAKESTYYAKSDELNFTVTDAKKTLQNISDTFERVEKIDGITIIEDTWWANVRASNTEPLVRLNVEADTPQILAEKIAELRKLITAKPDE